jgi:dienelactone hydrolase
MMAVRADRVEGRKRVVAGLNTLVAEANKRGIGDPSRKVAVGFCFGGGNVLELARAGADVSAVVCLHGDLATTMPAKKGDIKAA